MFAWDYTEMASCWCSLCSFFYAQVDTIRWSDILWNLWWHPVNIPWNSPFEMTNGVCYNAYVLPLPPWWRGWWCPWCVVSVTDVQGIRNSPSGREWECRACLCCAALSTRGSLQLRPAPVSSCTQTQVRMRGRKGEARSLCRRKAGGGKGCECWYRDTRPDPAPSACVLFPDQKAGLWVSIVSLSLRRWGGRVRSARV